ncbi:stage V sporulation protein T [Rummeliibacillus sp. G93]|nr:stage V sporulation protein T [Rummeliibacillus stabekisii]UQW98955.1 stage V sporulation protein T [Rummeliibacillus sp. G93]
MRMKATGIVRRIDDLGRVVIPKEIRRTLRIREGDPLEIFTDREGEIILKKYSPINELGDFALSYVDTLFETLGTSALVSDRDQVIAAAGVSKKDYLHRAISPFAEERILQRNLIVEKHESSIEIVPGQIEQIKSYCIAPIVVAGDAIGAVYILSKMHFIGDTEQKVAETAAHFLAKQMEG